jgi:hypothetical protein
MLANRLDKIQPIGVAFVLYFVQPRSEKCWDLPTKATQIDCTLSSRAAKIFGICQQKQLKSTVFCPAAQRKILNLPTKATQIDWFYGQPRCERVWNSPPKATQIDCLLSGRTAKTFGTCHQTQLKLTVF